MKVSVIVPTYNRKEDLVKCLSGLYDLNYPKEDFEIIVVNDGSTDETKKFLEHEKERITNLEAIHKDNGGAGSARNKGIEVAKGEYIFFIDDDCIPKSDWIHRHLGCYDEYDVSGVDGIQYPVDINLVEAFKLARYWKDNTEKMVLETEDANTVRSVTTNNLSYKKEVFEKSGTFDEEIMRGQDTEHGRRVLKAGFRILKNPDIRVDHLKKDGLKSFLKTKYKLGKELHKQTDSDEELENPRMNFRYILNAWREFFGVAGMLRGVMFPAIGVLSILSRKMGEINAN